MTDALVCWKCGAPLGDEPLPLGRRAECRSCRAELHVCRMCRFYDTAVATACREPVADPVQDKTRANFCGYFEVRPDAWRPVDGTRARAAGEELAALFGEAPAEEQGDADESPEAAAARRLRELLGGG